MSRTILLLTFALDVTAGMALLVWPRQVWSLVAGPADLGEVDFESLSPPATPNAFLACPKTICLSYPPDLESPTFDMKADALMARVADAWSGEPRIERVYFAPDELRARFIQRSAILKFPDTVSVRFYELPGGRSTLAIYSRSQIGYSDLGANEARVKRWLGLLQ